MSREEDAVDFSDMVLSDIHMHSRVTSLEDTKEEHLSVARFFFILSTEADYRSSSFEGKDSKSEDEQIKKIATMQPFCDGDGDLILTRNNDDRSDMFELITIVHNMATPLKYVGQQLWRGSFLLSDFILGESNLFKNKTCLELGSGVGMCSIIAGIDSVKVREINWLEDSYELTNCTGDFSWHYEDLVALENLDVILAADVIYDDHLTDAFFSTVMKLVKKSKNMQVSIFISVEKRIRQLQCSFPRYFNYDRVKELLAVYTQMHPIMEFDLCSVNKRQKKLSSYEKVTILHSNNDTLSRNPKVEEDDTMKISAHDLEELQKNNACTRLDHCSLDLKPALKVVRSNVLWGRMTTRRGAATGNEASGSPHAQMDFGVSQSWCIQVLLWLSK
eukprot:gene8726-9657_t